MPGNGRTRLTSLPRRQRGAATLVVVMILFFIMAMMAAYANRSLIFEQRIASNYYRVGAAVEVADAGIDWALAMLNGPKVDSSCKASNTGVDTFRQRYLNQDISSARAVTTVNPSAQAVAACVRTSAAGLGWDCSCPSAPSVPNVPVAAATQMQPSFQVSLVGSSAGIVTVSSLGCTSSTPSACVIGNNPGAAAQQLIGASQVTLKAALVSALKVPPAAPLTLRGSLDLSLVPGGLGLHNADAAGTGLLLLSGGTGALANARLDSLPGTPGQQAVSMNDASLSGTPTNAAMFARFFGMSEAQYQNQPAIRDAGCTTTCADVDIATAINAGAQIIWVEGPLTLSSTGTFGTEAQPVIIIVNGNLAISGSVTVNGVLYAVGNIAADAPQIKVKGAVIGNGNFSIASGLMDITYQAAVINTVSNTLGSFVRIPGSWFEGVPPS